MENGTSLDQTSLADSETLEEAAAAPLRPGLKAFRALRHYNYRLFFFGQMISIIGIWMQATALPLLIQQLRPTDSELWLGINSFLPLLPLIPLALIAGSWVDRYPKRKIIVLTQTAMMLQALALAALTAFGTVQIWQVLLLTFISGAANAIDVPARQAFVIEMVNSPDDLSSGIALNSAIFNLGRAIGPMLAGLSVAAMGFSAAFLINGLSFLAVIAGLLLMHLPPQAKQVLNPKTSAHLKEGLGYLRHNQLLMVLMSLVAISAFLSMPFITLMPVFAQQEAIVHSAKPIVGTVCHVITCQKPEAVPYGLMMGVFGMGALSGALVAGTYGDRGRGKLLTLGNLFFPATLVLFTLSQSLGVALIVLFVVGVAFILQNALANTLLQITVPDQLRGRVMSVYSMVFQGMSRAGGMQAGFTATLFGTPLAIASGAIASLAYGLFAFFKWPQIRKMK